jgi:hypothetical protein
MRPGSFRPTCRRAVRALAGVVAAFLLSGHVLAAAGLCAAKSPIGTPVIAPAASEAPCPQHVADESAPVPVAAPHCPVDDPSAQPRAVDVPAASLLAALPSAASVAVVAPARTVATRSERDRPTAPPLYARLQRLRL